MNHANSCEIYINTLRGHNLSIHLPLLFMWRTHSALRDHVNISLLCLISLMQRQSKMSDLKNNFE